MSGEPTATNGGNADAANAYAGWLAGRMLSLDLAVNAVVAGLLLGGFYAAVTVRVTISFGMLDIVNIAHPAFIMLGSFVAYIVNSNFGIDPILVGVVMAPVFFLVGMAVYQIYYYAFEQRGEESIQGLAFFFGLLFVGEVGLILVFGVDYRFVDAPYIGPSLHLGFLDLPLRMLVPFLVSLLMLAVLQVFLGRTFIGRAILAVSQDRLALQLMAANPSRIKRIAFGLSIATASVAGALLIIIQPVEPSIGRDLSDASLRSACSAAWRAILGVTFTREGAVAVFEAAKSPTATGMSRPVLRAAIFVVYGTLEPPRLAGS